jgi:hypothetical protein
LIDGWPVTGSDDQTESGKPRHFEGTLPMPAQGGSGRLSAIGARVSASLWRGLWGRRRRNGGRGRDRRGWTIAAHRNGRTIRTMLHGWWRRSWRRDDIDIDRRRRRSDHRTEHCAKKSPDRVTVIAAVIWMVGAVPVVRPIISAVTVTAVSSMPAAISHWIIALRD